MVVIVDYKSGNTNSIKNMIRRLGFSEVIISSEISAVSEAKKIIVAGVGHFDYGITQLKGSPFFEKMQEKVLHDKVPVLGICLGMQMFTEKSEEGSLSGLGWVKAKTVKFDPSKMDKGFKIPHFGWTNVTTAKSSPLLESLESDPELRFYFAHSFHVQCENAKDVLLEGKYGYQIVTAIEHENILGVQFHPEKSHRFGMRLLSNFIHNY